MSADMHGLEVFVTQLLRHLIIPVMVGLVSLIITTPVGAIPPLPASFYGEVRVNGENVPDGSVVRALINGRAYAESYTRMYQGVSVYVLDIPGDDTSTSIIEGGRDGDRVEFEVAGVLSEESASWHSGTNVQVDLTASANDLLIVTQATPSPLPTQTPITFAQPLPIKPISAQPSATKTDLVHPILTATFASELLPATNVGTVSLSQSRVLAEPSPIFHSTPMPVVSKKTAQSSSIHSTLTITLSAMIFVIGGSFWLVRKKSFIITKRSTSKQHKTKGGL